jgi:RimJ/RimL family protein N-acetyltransferase
MYPKLELASYFNQESDRLLYRRLSLDDISEWADFFIDNPNLTYLGRGFPEDPEEAAQLWVERQLDRYEEWGAGHLGVIEKKSGTLIGMCGLLSREIEGKNEYEVAYSIKPAYWRKGYGTEMARQMKKFGREHKLAPRFVSMIHPDNVGSIKVAENNGMTFLFRSTYQEMEVEVYGTIV